MGIRRQEATFRGRAHRRRLSAAARSRATCPSSLNLAMIVGDDRSSPYAIVGCPGAVSIADHERAGTVAAQRRYTIARRRRNLGAGATVVVLRCKTARLTDGARSDRHRASGTFPSQTTLSQDCFRTVAFKIR